MNQVVVGTQGNSTSVDEIIGKHERAQMFQILSIPEVIEREESCEFAVSVLQEKVGLPRLARENLDRAQRQIRRDDGRTVVFSMHRSADGHLFQKIWIHLPEVRFGGELVVYLHCVDGPSPGRDECNDGHHHQRGQEFIGTGQLADHHQRCDRCVRHTRKERSHPDDDKGRHVGHYVWKELLTQRSDASA